MYVEKIDGVYKFTSPTINGAFIVKLTLTKEGDEELTTIAVNFPVAFVPRKLKKGTIRKAIGETRWKNFLRMKKRGLASMFLEPHKKGFIPKKDSIISPKMWKKK